MSKLSIDEVIAHCNRHTERMESHSGRSQLEETPIGNSNIMKQYWEHRQVSEWLEELKQYREIGTVEKIKSFFNENRKAGYKHGYSDGRNEAIHGFEERMKAKYPYFVEDVGFVEANKMLHLAMEEIAEEMKGAGGKSED